MEIVELTQENMLSYAGAVNQSRAIPDARTGLKPIHRKILYEMYVDKIKSDGKYKKCAYMVGQIIARFSEHGDSATYDALVRLAQPWIQRYPLLDFHGNAGSQFGDSQAAMRYTESKLAKIAEDGFLYGLEKENVDWMLNFTNEEKEPTTLPALFPGLFCLPNQGIGYAIACQFLTMNLSEVVDGLIDVIHGKNFPIYQFDLASGGAIVNPEVMEKIYKTGKGTVIVDANYYISGDRIVVTEIPFNIMFDDILDEIVNLCEKEEIEGISDVKNNSGDGKLEMVIEVSPGYNARTVVNQLLEKTKLRTSYGINQIALVDNVPKLLTQQEMAEIYIEHNLDCIRREFTFDLHKTMDRIEILKGLIIALASIDDIVETIKNSENPGAAKEALINTYSFTENQAQAILDMKLSRLTRLDGVKLNNELEEKEAYANKCMAIVYSDQEKKNVLVERLRNLKDKYGDARRTTVTKKEIKKSTPTAAITKENVIEECVITYNPDGYLQRIPITSYRKSNFVSFKTTTGDFILLFSNLGRLFRLAVKDVKSCQPKDKGSAIGALVKFKPGEKILNVFSDVVNEKHPFLVFALANGRVKKTEKSDYIKPVRNKSGLIAVKNDDTKVIGVQETNGDNIILGTKNNYYIRFSAKEIRLTRPSSAGVVGIKLNDGDEVEELVVCDPDQKWVSTSRIGVQPFARQKRAGKGAHRTVKSEE